MPLSKSGEKTLKAFIEEYGPVKGKAYFYAYENKHKHDKRGKKLKKHHK